MWLHAQDFLLAGAHAVTRGFAHRFLPQAWDLPDASAKTLVTSQHNARLAKPARAIFKAFLDHADATANATAGTSYPPELGEFIYNLKAARKDPDVPRAGRVAVLTGAVLPALRRVHLGADLVELDPGGQVSPGYSADAAFQVTYVVRGSGRVQVVGEGGRRVVDARLRAGDFFIVPRFHVVSKRAGSTGLQWFSIITAEAPVFTNLAGSTSVFKALSPAVVRAALNVDEGLEAAFRQRRDNDPVFFPPLDD